VEWDIEDPHLNQLSLQVHYRQLGSKDDRDWLPVTVPAVARGDQSWTPQINGPLEVRLYVKDRAGNEALQSTLVTPGSGRPPGSDETRALVRYVPKRRVQLKYHLDNVGDSGVQSVEVWVTRDTQNWRKARSIERKDLLMKIDDSRPAEEQKVVLDLDEAGRWGVTIIPRSGVGLAEPPPRGGDTPHLWIEVDETAPVVTIREVVVGQQGADLGRITIYYSASDRFLKANPISISYAETLTGAWVPLKKDLENSGSYSFQREKRDDGKWSLPFQFYLKVEAVDEAGNIGSAVTRETVKVDTQVPRARTINVDVDGLSSSPGPARP
jgi:hypothetical protein